MKNHKIEWKWIKGHSGHVENERADYLANKAINMNIDLWVIAQYKNLFFFILI